MDVLDPVARELGLPITGVELARSVEATVPMDVIIEIAATHPDPGQAAKIADALGAQLVDAAAGLSPNREHGTEAVRATTLKVAQSPPRLRHQSFRLTSVLDSKSGSC
jgi:tyrosine-protein kinase